MVSKESLSGEWETGNLQGGPDTADAPWHVLHVQDEETPLESLLALQPHALAAARGVTPVVHTHVNAVSIVADEPVVLRGGAVDVSTSAY